MVSALAAKGGVISLTMAIVFRFAFAKFSRLKYGQ